MHCIELQPTTRSAQETKEDKDYYSLKITTMRASEVTKDEDAIEGNCNEDARSQEG